MAKRWLLPRLIVCLSLGAATTVAVAWSGLRYGPYTTFGQWRLDNDTGVIQASSRTGDQSPPTRSHYEDSLSWVRDRAQDHVPRAGYYLDYRCTLAVCHGALLEEIIVAGSGKERHPKQIGDTRHYDFEAGVQIVRVGWPIRAFSSGATFTGRTDSTIVLATRVTLVGGLNLKFLHENGLLRKPDLPLRSFRPIWPGFVINSITYATVFFLALVTPPATRRAIRTRRGRCPKCGYDLRGQRAASDLKDPHPRPLSRPRKMERGEQKIGCPECGWNRE